MTSNQETSSASQSALASVAAARSTKAPSARRLGTGLEAKGVHAWFGSNHVLSDISIDFASGSVTALIGPSGCGKSTFIRTLNRMHEFIPTAAMAGEVLLDGKDIYAPGTDVTKIRLKVGMVFQKPNPFPSMTIGENVLSGLRLAQLKSSNKDDLVEECLQRAGLWNEVKDRLGEYDGSLSGGQQQRVAIIRAVALRPSVLLLDEVTAALDPQLVGEVLDLIAELRTSGMTMLMATHEMNFARDVADTVCFLHEGAIHEMGRPEVPPRD